MAGSSSCLRLWWWVSEYITMKPSWEAYVRGWSEFSGEVTESASLLLIYSVAHSFIHPFISAFTYTLILLIHLFIRSFINPLTLTHSLIHTRWLTHTHAHSRAHAQTDTQSHCPENNLNYKRKVTTFPKREFKLNVAYLTLSSSCTRKLRFLFPNTERESSTSGQRKRSLFCADFGIERFFFFRPKWSEMF